MNKPDFKSDLEFAQAYEKKIAKHYGCKMSKDRRWDIEKDGVTIELKIDRYFDSKNFFIETMSDTKSKKLGGPYRSLEDKVDEFWYVFVCEQEAVVYKWKTKKLVKELEGIRGWEKLIINKGWTTKGKLIRRSSLKCEPETITFKNERKKT